MPRRHLLPGGVQIPGGGEQARPGQIQAEALAPVQDHCGALDPCLQLLQGQHGLATQHEGVHGIGACGLVVQILGTQQLQSHALLHGQEARSRPQQAIQGGAGLLHRLRRKGMGVPGGQQDHGHGGFHRPGLGTGQEGIPGVRRRLMAALQGLFPAAHQGQFTGNDQIQAQHAFPVALSAQEAATCVQSVQTTVQRAFAPAQFILE